jgi:hypothetical protein
MRGADKRGRRIAKLVMFALLAAACDEPAKTPIDQKGDGGTTAHEGVDKSHCN